MDVDRAVGGQFQHRPGEDQPIGGDDQEVGRERGQRGACRRVFAQGGRLLDGQAIGERLLLDRSDADFVAAACGAVGLGDHGDHLPVVGGGVVMERDQGGHGKFRRPHHDNAEGRGQGGCGMRGHGQFPIRCVEADGSAGAARAERMIVLGEVYHAPGFPTARGL